MAGRAVRLFLVDGSPTGLRTAEVGQWSGQAIVAPRTDLQALGRRDEVRRPGVYVLVGPSDDDPGKTAVYVGESDDVWSRLTSHDSKKDFWTWVVVFVSKDLNLTKAHVKWLEAKLARELNASKLVDLQNANEPATARLPEADESDMETFMENVRLLLPLVGLNVFTSVTGRAKDAEAGGLRLKLVWDEVTADCVANDGAFIVQKGSWARRKNVESLSPNYQAMRSRLIENGVLVDWDDETLKFAQDYRFDSPTAAAVAVTGTTLNGREVWKVTATGESYKEWQERQVAASVVEA